MVLEAELEVAESLFLMWGSRQRDRNGDRAPR